MRNFKGVKRRFTKTGEWNGVTIIDDYGHHPVEIAAVLKAARAIVSGKVIAVVQPHRYTASSHLFDEFCTCFNDADAGPRRRCLCRRRGADRGRDPRCAGRRPHARTAIAMSARWRARAMLAPLVRELARPGDIVVCLGAGSITNWANNLPGDLDGARQHGATADDCARGLILRRGRSLALPTVRGRLTADAPIGAARPGSGVGGPAEMLFRPADGDDLAAFLAALPARRAGYGDRRRRSNLLVRDGGIAGVVDPSRPRLRRDRD